MAKNDFSVKKFLSNAKKTSEKVKKVLSETPKRVQKAMKDHNKRVDQIESNFNRKWKKIWSSNNSNTSRSTTAGSSVSSTPSTPWLRTDTGKYTMYGLGALGLLAAGIYGAKEIRDWNNLYSNEPDKVASLSGVDKVAAPINYNAAMNSVRKLQSFNRNLANNVNNITKMQNNLFNKYMQNSKRLQQAASGMSTPVAPKPGIWDRIKSFFKGGELKEELFDATLIKTASADIQTMTRIKLANYEWMEKIANPLGISTGAQLMQHISNSPMTFLTNLRKSIQSGKFINNLEPLKKFRAMYGKNPNLLSMGNRMGFTGYLDNYLARATQGIGRPATAAAVSSNAARVQRAVQKSRIGSATNGIPYFGAYYA